MVFCRTDNQVKNRWHSTLEKEAVGEKHRAHLSRKEWLDLVFATGLDGQTLLSVRRGAVVSLCNPRKLPSAVLSQESGMLITSTCMNNHARPFADIDSAFAPYSKICRGKI